MFFVNQPFFSVLKNFDKSVIRSIMRGARILLEKNKIKLL